MSARSRLGQQGSAASQKANKTWPQIKKILAEAAERDAAEDLQQDQSPQPATPRALAQARPPGKTAVPSGH